MTDSSRDNNAGADHRKMSPRLKKLLNINIKNYSSVLLVKFGPFNYPKDTKDDKTWQKTAKDEPKGRARLTNGSK